MLTARDSVSTGSPGSDSGADDYLVKPFAIEELAARVRALGRRGRGAGAADDARRGADPARRGDPHRHRRRAAGRPQPARVRASSSACLRHRGRVLSRDQLLDHAWPYDAEVTPAIVDTYVYFLRRKLGPVAGGSIETVRGMGYRAAA